MRHHVGLYLAHEVHRNDHHDQQRSTAEVEWNVESEIQEFRNKAYEHQIDSSAEGQTKKNSVDVAGSLVAWTNARNERSASL